ncbi:hypothetical protein EI77_03361 [Prosthecobacter fusiformis]|uniref:Uncharacterized protein n=1 Tax=Prosthecobacter fusiformis TaxID=48464 RepID=A0A4R7RNW3_9BACT|nr:hypothetical protein EI77_03361 [Prosthecobacter fusiformis]
MPKPQTHTVKPMTVLEIRKVFSEALQRQLSLQGPMTVAKVQALQATMKPRH